ncbi:hypothetical protein PHLCEN_2v5195 [Hermanssonia centrifuga]|uniref:Uncharacterized protein n=1 Tax=Hermanssonia centrifuga TaxID=98765 RepID=A0A2R6P8T7_9APHY|nr:hypothetical protein PHLCEN_2v5195 [Hermanssonia centrifuga]
MRNNDASSHQSAGASPSNTPHKQRSIPVSEQPRLLLRWNSLELLSFWACLSCLWADKIGSKGAPQ